MQSAEIPLATLTRPPWQRTLRGMLVAVACFVLFIGGASVLLMWSCDPPSFGTLERRFVQEKSELETIVAMSDVNAQLIAIDPQWLATTNRQCERYCAESGITPQRYNQYRRLFAQTGLSQGLRRDGASGDVFLIVKSAGLLNRGTSNGYLHCGQGQKHRYGPCFSTDASGQHTNSPGDEAYSFRRVAHRWYVYSEGPG